MKEPKSELKERAKKLGLRAIVADWDHYAGEKWLEPVIIAEEAEKDRRSLERRLREAQIGQFKPMSQFDWDWPQVIDREQIEELLTLEFMKKKINVVLVSTNGLGKTMIAQNLANAALSRGYATRFVKASQMLNQLLECDGARARALCLKKYCAADLLLIDEVGYMNYDNRYADLLYEVISGRYQKASTVVTTNRGFKQWGEIFPNAACVVTMVDRLIHHSETVLIEGESYRQREAMERAAEKEKERQVRRGKSKKETSTNKEKK
jgi:DNA replication protein DnaC